MSLCFSIRARRTFVECVAVYSQIKPLFLSFHCKLAASLQKSCCKGARAQEKTQEAEAALRGLSRPIQGCRRQETGSDHPLRLSDCIEFNRQLILTVLARGRAPRSGSALQRASDGRRIARWWAGFVWPRPLPQKKESLEDTGGFAMTSYSYRWRLVARFIETLRSFVLLKYTRGVLFKYTYL